MTTPPPKKLDTPLVDVIKNADMNRQKYNSYFMKIK